MASAISDDVLIARGYQTVTKKSELADLGFPERQRIVPTLLMPVWSIAGGDATYQHRPDGPRHREGKPLKYETPAKSGMAVDVNPLIVEKVRDPRVPLVITEGIKKADAAISAGLCCVALLGVWNWRGANEHGGLTALPDWEMVAFKHKDGTPREVSICFDSDVVLKRPVYEAMRRLAALVEKRGAAVTFIYLPDGPDGQKVGLDDYLAAGHSRADVLARRDPTLRQPPDDGREHAMPYRETSGGLVWDKPSGEGVTPVRLANFNARITAEDALDDGVTRTLHYRITATLADGTARETDVAAVQYDALNWVSALGMDFLLEPGPAVKDRARYAIKALSTGAEKRTVYTHTGWAKRDSGWLYLHAGGAIGADAGAAVSVQLPPSLSLYQLPMETDPDPRASVAASLRFARLYPSITMPLAAAAFRAPLGAAEYSIYLTGETGTFKSTLAALVQQHYGPGMMDTTTLPANWSSTGNALEVLAFHAKDTLLTIDEAVRTESPTERNKLAATQARVLRAQGNQSGRARLTADGRLKPEHPPRGLILTTGEQPAAGHSLNARLLLLELEPGMVTLDRIIPCQQEAAAGLYARTMAGYIGYLATDLDHYTAEHRNRAAAWYDTFRGVGGHPRIPKMLADLMAAWEGFTRWAVSIGALSEVEASVLAKECGDALTVAANEQARNLRNTEPTARYLELLEQALASGRAHLLDASTGTRPEVNPQAHGWVVLAGAFPTEWRAGGQHIGWLGTSGVYLLPDAAYNAAQAMGREAGSELALESHTMRRRLKDRNRLVDREAGRKRLTVRQTFPNAGRVEVLHLKEWRDVPDASEPDHSIGERPSQLSQPSQNPTDHAEGGTLPRDVSNGHAPQTSQQSVPKSLPGTLGTGEGGTFGTVGTFCEAYSAPITEGDTHTPDIGNGSHRTKGVI
jgi:hypothetical protein